MNIRSFGRKTTSLNYAAAAEAAVECVRMKVANRIRRTQISNLFENLLNLIPKSPLSNGRVK